MTSTFVKNRIAAVAVLASTMIVGGGLAATEAQAATLGTVSFPSTRDAGPTSRTWQTSWNQCKKRFPSTLRSTQFVRVTPGGSTTITSPDGSKRTVRIYNFTYRCSNTP